MARPLRPLEGATDFLPAFAATEVSPPQPMDMVPPCFVVFEHDADLEEPAILFANGDTDGAEQGMLELIARRDVPAQLPVWLALLDLYRAADRPAQFDKAGIEFAARFGRSAPQWFAMTKQRSGVVAAASGAVAPQGWRWSAPAQITPNGVTALKVSQAKAGGPWTLDWAAVAGIDEAAAPALEALLQQWADTQGVFVLLNAERLLALLGARSPSGDGSVDTLWWRLRMALLRLMNRQDDFELVALDYCVTYEVSPPPWVDPVAQCMTQAADAGAPEVPAQFGPVEEQAVRFVLAGIIEGDASSWLDPVQEGASLGEPVVIDCTQLVRMDFAAAGSVLNWAAHMQSLGHVIQFSQLHQLVAVFFNVIGIQEHAQVNPRKD
ncbi:ATP-dependent protease HslVU (ClpYQ), peptidase subunit [Delftia tsuruhatensis]|nr:ATP-dependent protease HslVU (ClpYQ), peptidase subunit [Delftia tsuruhatensis]